MEIDLSPPYYTPYTPPPPICTRIGRYIIHSNLLLQPSNFSYVYLCFDTIDKIKKVIKFIKYVENRKEKIQNEIEIMLQCKHPNIIQIEDHFRYDAYMCIVLPYTPHRSVWTFLQNYCPQGIPDEIAKKMMIQMLNAVNYLHQMSILHGDIKPENFLIFLSPQKSMIPDVDDDEDEEDNSNISKNVDDVKNEEDNSDISKIVNMIDEETDLYNINFDINSINVVLSDFGLSKRMKKNEKLNEYEGSFEYMAPEIINENGYDITADIWALGVTLFRMLTNHSPFPDTKNTYQFFMRKLRKGELNMKILKIHEVSNEAVELINKMCKLEPSERCTALEAISHLWFESLFNKTERQSAVAYAIGLSFSIQSNPGN